ncbi:MAG: sigma-54-dependent Fis family transcriptional regulator [Desulfobacteraceae bacterium]|nr:sigma-54-dependent Fis family transcriptional regulator [Desulfobacteraceae bacterium]MBC2720524.1 sigma-54-dependent Fis family transcriptional regulator [Desulfobacteraceae bacterium]
MGGNKDINIDIQVVTATNRPLEKMKDDGRFREDLYYRLNVFPIHLPPLRERRKDITLLAKYFLNQLRKKGKTRIKSFADNAVELMLTYRWPGNVRQLQSVISSAVLVCGLEGSPKIAKRHIEPLLLPQSTPHDGSSSNIFKTLAETELRMVENALIRSGGKKMQAWKLLNYKNRFTMLRRVKRIMSEHPELTEQFPELKKSYS